MLLLFGVVIVWDSRRQFMNVQWPHVGCLCVFKGIKQSSSLVVGVSELQSVCCGLACRIGSHLAILSRKGEGE